MVKSSGSLKRGENDTLMSMLNTSNTSKGYLRMLRDES